MRSPDEKNEPKDTLKILLVEDNEHDVRAFERAMSRCEMPVDICTVTRAEAIGECIGEQFERIDEYDLVVSDYRLPGINGLDLFRRILEKIRDTPLVLLTGSGNEQVAVEAIRLGVDDYIVKDPMNGYLELLPTQIPRIVRRHWERSLHLETEAALLESEFRFRQLAETIDEVFWLSKPGAEGRIIYVSPAFEKIWGIARERVYENPEVLFESIHPEEREAVRRAIDDLNQTEHYAVDYRIRRPDGEIRWIWDRGYAIRNGEGSLDRTMGVASDITEEKRAEEALRESEDRLRQVIDLVPHMIFAKDREGRFLLVNRATAERYGMSVEELIGKRRQDVHPNAEEAADYLEDDRRVLASNQELAREEIFTNPDGSRSILQTIKMPFRMPGYDEPVILGVSVDISEIKRAEDQRRRIESQMLRSQKLESLGVMAGGIAHDFNNLLMAILGNAHLALMDLPSASIVRTCIEEIERATQRASDLTSQMLAYSGSGRITSEPIDLSEMISGVSRLIDVSTPTWIEVSFDLEGDMPSTEVDPSQVRQGLVNLINNAVEAIGEKSGRIVVRTGKCAIGAEELKQAIYADHPEPGNYVYFEVSDTGCGITPENLSQIFDPFFSTKFTGRGLGLAALMGIVRSHHGVIDVRSEVGKGTTFRVLLPGSEKKAVSPPPLVEVPQAIEGQKTILIVDDEKMVLTMARELLERKGFHVLMATDGLEALELFRIMHQEIDVVLLDLTMPGMNGVEVYEQMTRMDPQVQVILTSGYSEQTVMPQFDGHVLAGFIQKPYRAEELEACLAQVLAER